MCFYLLSKWGAREAMTSSTLARRIAAPAWAMKQTWSEGGFARSNSGGDFA